MKVAGLSFNMSVTLAYICELSAKSVVSLPDVTSCVKKTPLPMMFQMQTIDSLVRRDFVCRQTVDGEQLVSPSAIGIVENASFAESADGIRVIKHARAFADSLRLRIEIMGDK